MFSHMIVFFFIFETYDHNIFVAHMILEYLLNKFNMNSMPLLRFFLRKHTLDFKPKWDICISKILRL